MTSKKLPEIPPLTAKILLQVHKTVNPPIKFKNLMMAFLTVYQEHLEAIDEESLSENSLEEDTEWQSILGYLSDAGAVLALTKKAQSYIEKGSISNYHLMRSAVIYVGYQINEETLPPTFKATVEAVEIHMNLIFGAAKEILGRDFLRDARIELGIEDSFSYDGEIDPDAEKMIADLEKAKNKKNKRGTKNVRNFNIGKPRFRKL